MTTADDLRRRSRFLMIAAILVDLAGVAAILLPVVQGEDVMTTLPLAIILFVVASGLFLASIRSRKQAETAE
ncbi:MAG: hypothetical protein AAF791_13640 [Bacteroidota bacterium]